MRVCVNTGKRRRREGGRKGELFTAVTHPLEKIATQHTQGLAAWTPKATLATWAITLARMCENIMCRGKTGEPEYPQRVAANHEASEDDGGWTGSKKRKETKKKRGGVEDEEVPSPLGPVMSSSPS